MTTYTVDRSAVSRQSANALFARLLDAASWPDWSGHRAAAVVTPSPTANGVGEVRRFSKNGMATVERVVVAADPHTFSYELISGVPVKNYVGTVTLTSLESGGCRINWRSTFDGKYPLVGALVKMALDVFIGRAARDLATAEPLPE